MSAYCNYHLAAKARRAEVGLRFGFAVLIAIAAVYGSQSWLALAWLAVVGTVQLANLAAGAPAYRDPAFVPGRAWELRYLAVQFLNSAVFVAIGPYLWFACGAEGRLIAMVVLMGGLLNFGTHPHTSGRLLWAGCLPYAAALGSLPMLTVAIEPHVSSFLMAALTLGSGLYLLHVLRAVRRRDEAVAAANEALARAEQASAAKSTFLATMSHEIRTPMNGVLGMAQAMAADELSEAQRQRLDVIGKSGALLLTLLNDVLDLTKIEARKFELEDGLVDVAELAEETQAAFEPLAQEKGVELSVIAPVDGTWRGDPSRVRQILYNLLSNAVKFTGQGGVRARLQPDPGGGLRIEVRDTGEGISEADQARLFDRFTQADPSTTRRFGGTGLGLAIARELARLMGGDLTVESALGRGSAFVAHLPLQRIAARKVGPERLKALPASDLRVLVAEDNETNRLVVSTLLEQLGMSVQFATNGAEAVAAWRSQLWDLVLMDIQMPVMDGRQAVQEIRTIEARTGRSRTPIIALTANAMRHQIEEYAQDGFDAVAPKPIQLALLVSAIEAVLNPPAGAVPLEGPRRSHQTASVGSKP